MATDSHNIYITKKQNIQCNKCRKQISNGNMFVAESEDHRGLCFNCSPFKHYTLLPPGDVALTRRSKKHSTLCGVVLFWNNKRRRYERRGQYVEPQAIEKAQEECLADKEKRELKNIKAAAKREIEDKEYVLEFGFAIRHDFPNCPPEREYAIAKHACEKHSGRVGRSANAKKFDKQMIDLAVEAHIRHIETNYDSQFGKGKNKREIRADLSHTIKSIINSWR